MKTLAVKNIDQAAVSLGAEFTLQQGMALEVARAVTSVTDAESQETAAQAASKLQALISQLEKDRTAVKAPVLDIGRKIDAVAKEGAAPLAKELDRIKGLLKTFVIEEQKKAQKKQETANKFADARRRRLEEEAAEQAKAGHTEAAAETTQKAAEIATPVPAAMPPKADKMTVRKVWKYEVTDVAALHAARPTLTKIEPVASAILAEIRGGMRECAGLRIWEDVDVTARS